MKFSPRIKVMILAVCKDMRKQPFLHTDNMILVFLSLGIAHCA